MFISTNLLANLLVAVRQREQWRAKGAAPRALVPGGERKNRARLCRLRQAANPPGNRATQDDTFPYKMPSTRTIGRSVGRRQLFSISIIKRYWHHA